MKISFCKSMCIEVYLCVCAHVWVPMCWGHMCEWMCIEYMCVYVHMCTWVYMCVSACMCGCTCECMYVWMHVYEYTCVWVQMYMWVPSEARKGHQILWLQIIWCGCGEPKLAPLEEQCVPYVVIAIRKFQAYNFVIEEHLCNCELGKKCELAEKIEQNSFFQNSISSYIIPTWFKALVTVTEYGMEGGQATEKAKITK